MATRDQIETELVGRTRVALRTAAFSAAPDDDPSPRHYLNDPIRRGLVALGLPVADPFAVVDLDLSGLDGERLGDLLDIAELAVLEAALTNIDLVDVRATSLTESWSQYADRLAAIIARKRKALEDRIGLDVSPPEAGRIKLGFVASQRGGGEFEA